MSAAADYRLRPSKTYLWRKILYSKTFSKNDLHTLVGIETVGTSFYEMRAYISKYRPESWVFEWETSKEDIEDRKQAVAEFAADMERGKWNGYRRVSKEVKEELDYLLESVCPFQQRKLELAWLRLIRGDGKLSLSLTGLKKEYTNRNMQTTAPDACFFLDLLADCAQRGFHYAVVWGNEASKANLKRVLDAITDLRAGVPAFKSLPLVFAYSASVVVPFFGAEIYNYLIYFAYKNKLLAQPTPIHSAVVSVARPVIFRGELKPGLSAILNPSIDDTLGEALDFVGIERRTTTILNNIRIQKETISAAAQGSPNRTLQVVYQMNGWMPRKFHEPKIETLTCNMLQRAGGAELGNANDSLRFSAAVAKIYEDYFPDESFLNEAIGCATLEHGSHMLVVGIEVEEVAGVDRLRQEADSGAQFIALIRWPRNRIGHAYSQASKESIRFARAMLNNSQVDPIWFDDPVELPRMLCKLVRD